MKIIPKNQLKAAAALACVGLLTLTVQSGMAQNLLTDPGFELETAAPNPDPNGVPGWANFGAQFLTTPLAHSGSNVLSTPGGGGNYSVPGSYQVLAASAGQTFTLSGWVYTPNTLVAGDNDFAILQLSFFTGAPPNNYAGGTGVNTVGVDIGEANSPGANADVPISQGVWTYASVTGVAGAGVNSLGVYILDINADSNASFYFDDLSLTASPVPEPATLSLCALGGLAGFAGLRLRRKA